MLEGIVVPTRRGFVLGIALFALTAAGCGSSSSSPEGAVEGLYKSLAANKVDEAAGYFSARHMGQNAQATRMQEYLRTVLAQAAPQLQQAGLAGVKILDTQRDDPVASVTAEVSLKDGRTQQVRYSMTKEDGGWKAVLHESNLSNLQR